MKKVVKLESADASKFLTIEEASRILSVRSGVLRNYLSMGKFTRYKFKTLTLLDAEEVKTWKHRTRK